MDIQKESRITLCWLLLSSLFLLTLTTPFTQTQASGWKQKSGIVMRRSIMLSEGTTGHPVYVAIDEEGREVREIGVAEPGTPIGNASVMSASEYRSYLTTWQTLKEEHPNAELITRTLFQNDFSGATPLLLSSTHTVLIDRQRFQLSGQLSGAT